MGPKLLCGLVGDREYWWRNPRRQSRIKMRTILPALRTSAVVRVLAVALVVNLAVLAHAQGNSGNSPGKEPLDVSVVRSTTLPVQNTDEPGRQPHAVWVEFVGGGSGLCSWNCENISIFGNVILLDVSVPVPEGKRWVITHVSGRIPTAQPFGHVALQSQRVISAQRIVAGYFGPFTPILDSGSQIMLGFSGPIFATVGPGEKAHLNILAPNVNSFFAFVSLSGYLIDAPAASATLQSPTGLSADPKVLPGTPAGGKVLDK
jgi:hypothetical protein